MLYFLENSPQDEIRNTLGNENELVKEIFSSNPNISFIIDIEKEPVCSLVQLHADLKKDEKSSKKSDEGICLVTGKVAPIERIHAKLKNVFGAQSTGASIVSFNQASFCSFGKDQNFNAPISKSAAFAYTTALNTMLDKNSENKMRVGDATAVFWSDVQTNFESDFAAFFNYNKDDPDKDIRAVRAFYDSTYTGYLNQESNTKFYVLGLSPNAGRLSIRFWKTGTIAEFSDKIRQHFDDFKITRPKNDLGRDSLFWILSAIALEHKTDNVPPNLSGDVVRAILEGLPYPVTLQHQCIRRIRAERDVGRIRAGILKAFLNRKNRFYQLKEKELTVALDYENSNIGYRLGRLFATFEKLQEDAQPGINATIKDRFYGAASSTPSTVFPQLFKLKNHHLAKLSNVGAKIAFEKLIGEIVYDIASNGVPAHLNLDDQSRFAIGYYHQRQEFYKKRDEKSNQEN